MVGFKDVAAIMRAATVVRYQVGTIYVRGSERRTIWENHGFAVSPPGILKPIRFRDYAPVYSESHLHLTDSEPSSRGFKASFSNREQVERLAHLSSPFLLCQYSAAIIPRIKLSLGREFGFKYDSSTFHLFPSSTKRPYPDFLPCETRSITRESIDHARPPLCNQRYSYVLRITAA